MAGYYNEVQVPASHDGGRFVELAVQSEANIEINVDDSVFQDKAGGFTYKHNRLFSRTTRNRSIFWKVSQNCIYLTEISQDLHLYGNQLCLKTKNVSFLPQVNIIESKSLVSIVVATQHTVHRLTWHHPIKEKQGVYISSSIDASSASIFANNPTGITSDAWSFTALPKKSHLFSAEMSNAGECMASLITNEGSLLLVVLPAFNSQASPQITELKQTSIMNRLWTGLVPTVLRGDNLPHDSVHSCQMHTVGKETFIFTLCKDLKMRVWSCKSLECIDEHDLAKLLPDFLDIQSGIAQAHLTRKAADSEADNHYLGVFLSFRLQSLFFAFEMIEDDGDIELYLLSSHSTKLTSLLDFALTPRRIWALWSSTDGDSVLQYSYIEENPGSNTTWYDVTLQTGQNTNIFIHHSAEPKEIYLSNLFMPGRFSKKVLLKTIEMTIKSFDDDVDLHVSSNSSLEELQEAIERLVQYEVQNFTLDHDLDQEEIYNFQAQSWSKFYASAAQYDQVERKPVGLFSDETSGLVTVIRQNYRGYLVSKNWLENLYVNTQISHESSMKYLIDEAGIADTDVALDIMKLVDCLKSISAEFSDATLNNIESSVANNDDIKEIFSSLANDLLSDSSNSADLVGDVKFANNFARNLELKLKDLHDLEAALSAMVDSLDPVRWLPADFENLDDGLQIFSVNSGHSFSSKEGRAVIVEAIYKRAQINMEICRDFLLLINSLICLVASAKILDDKRATLENQFVPKLLDLLRCFFTIIWLRRSTMSIENADYVESSLKKLSALELVDIKPSAKKSRWEGFANQSILSCYVSEIGMSNSLKVFGRLPAVVESQRKASRPWDYDFTLISDMIFRALWPSRHGTQLPEFLLSRGQATFLIEYLFICSEWCTKNRGSREFLMGQAYLQNGEHEKARQRFFEAAKFIAGGEDLLSRIIPEDVVEIRNMIIYYFIKVMRLFEQFENPEMMVLVATAAIRLAKNSKTTEVAMLWSNIFKCHLQLGNIKEAYEAVVRNPDKQRRRNCLHNFVVTLCERKKLTEICSFAYSSMEDDVVKILETRARTVDITINDYYDILYAFHVYREDMRRAATSMYEYACRLRTEMHGLESLQQQAKCYLATINCLRICDINYAWIVRPAKEEYVIDEEEDELASAGRSPKRSEDGEIKLNIVDSRKGTKKTVIVELSDLEKEYLLIVARLNLFQFDKSTSTVLGLNVTANEMIPLLCQAGLFDRAFAVAVAFKLDLNQIFEGVAAKCVRVANDVSKGIVTEDAFNWLAANDIGSAQTITDISAVEQTWRLLRSYLIKFTKINGPIYHKSIARKLLSLSYSLPTWFVNDYKEKNAAELLRIYINFDLLEEAGELAIEYINAALGIGKENFGIKDALHASSPPVWLPYSALDQLILHLKDNYAESRLRQVHHDLDLKMKQYFDTVKMVSQDKVDMAYRNRLVQASKA